MKIWSKLFLVAATGMMMFSSCLKNIEPEGIADLRGAKAELLRAQTALAEANAAKVNADAAFVQAQAKIQEAIAKQEEAKVAYYEAQALLAQYEAEYQALENAAYEAEKAIELEQKMAEAQAAIAEAEALAAVYAAELERDLLLVQAEIAAAQAAYESALKDLAIAKNSLTPDQLGKIGALENAVNEARNGVEAKTKALEAAAKQLATMLAEVDEAKINKALFASVERAIVISKAALEGAVKAEAEAKAALELDPSVTDWEAKVEAYEAEIAKLDSEWYKKDAEIDEQMASMRDSAKVDGAIGKMVADYTAYTGYPFDENTGYFSKIYDEDKQIKNYPIGEVYVTAPVDEDGKPLFDGDFNLSNKEYTYDKENTVIKEFEDKVKELSKLNAKTFEANITFYESLIKAYKEDLDYKFKLAKYNDAVAAYKAGDVLAYFNKYVFDEGFDLTVAVKEYNDALTAMEAAVKNFNDTYDKYNPDFSEEYAAALAAKAKAYNDAAVVKAQEYQKAEDDNKYAYNKDVVWADAKAAWADAQTAYAKAVEAALETVEEELGVGVTVDQMEAFVESYDEETATDENKDTYAVYEVALDEVDKASKAKTAAEADYNKAEEAWKKVDEAYQKAIEAANDKEADAQKTADETLAKAEAAIKAKTPTFDKTYMQSLQEQVATAKTDLQKKVDAIRNAATADLTESYSLYYVDFVLNLELPLVGNIVYRVTDIPEFMMDITVDTEGKHYAAAPVVVADFVDKEYFKKNPIRRMYDNLTTVYMSYYVVNLDTEDNIFITNRLWNVAAENAPLELPAPEDYVEAWKDADFYDTPNHVYELAEYFAEWNEWDNWSVSYALTRPSAYYADYLYAEEIDKNKTNIENLKKLPDFVKAIEAAQAEFEALVAENAAQLAADKAEVEAFYAKYLAAEEKATAELEAINAKNDAVKSRLTAMNTVIKEYCTAKNNGTATTTVDALVAALQTNYEAAVNKVIAAEQAVINAEKTLEDLKAGVVSAADAAQRAYDRAAEELAEAIAKLERAAADLEAVISAIYGEEAEETPAE